MPEPTPPRPRSIGPLAVGVAVGAALVLGGIGIGYLAFGSGDDDEPEAAVTTVAGSYQGMATPPLGRRIWPVMNLLASEARYRTA